MNTRKFCLALDLKDNPDLISKYEEYHKNVWREIEQSITDSGIVNMEIYRVENRLFMIMEVNEDFSFEKKSKMDAQNPVVQKWEALMSQFQQQLPNSAPYEKWRLMDRIYSL